MGKKITRPMLRGKPLDPDCRKAYKVKHEYGPEDDRVFCFGLTEDMADWKIQDKCLQCGAYVGNCTPPKEDES